MRSLLLLALLVGLLLIARAGRTWFSGSSICGASAPTTEGRGDGAAQLLGRRQVEGPPASDVERDAEDERRCVELTAAVVGPPGRPHTPADRLRLLAERDTAWEEQGDQVELALRMCEDQVANDLSRPCGVLLTGWEEAGDTDVDAKPRIDSASGTFEAVFRPPFGVEALYVYGGRILARAPLTDAAPHLRVDPAIVFGWTGGLELSVRRGDTADTVADVRLELEPVGRDARTCCELLLDGESAVGVRPYRFPDLPPGAYHVRVERAGPPWSFGAATVEVRPGSWTRETISLGPGASFRTRWFRPDGRPTGSQVTAVRLRDRENRCHEVPARHTAADPHLILVDRAPPGPCWLVTDDQRAHRLDLRAGDPGPELVVRLRDWTYVVLAASLESLVPRRLARSAPSVWVVRDEQGVIVETDRMALTADARDDDGKVRGWAHLVPGRYHVHWQLTPDRAVEASFEVPPGCETFCVDLDVTGP